MQSTTEGHHTELLSANELRAILRIGRSAFYDLARRDALPVPTIRVGHRLMFSRRAVEALLDRQHADAARISPDQRVASQGM